MLHPAIEAVMGDVIHGSGLVARGFIGAGEVVSQVEPTATTMRIADLLALTPDEQERLLHHAYQCSEDLLMFEGEPEHLMNHSCDPNVWWLDDQTMVARRDIQPGEEVTYDYAMTEVHVPLDMVCGCGSPMCRGRVTNRDHLDPAWQARYGHHLPGHTLRAMRVVSDES